MPRFATSNMFKISFILFFSLHCVLSADKPCGQHSFKINYLRNCRDKGSPSNAFQMQNMTFSITDDCRLVPRGCYLVKKKVSDIKVNYALSKPPMFNKNGTEDLCKALTDASFQKMAAPYKTVDSKCPIESGQYCIMKGSTLIDKLNPSILNMAVGTIRARVEMISEKSKAQACIELEAVISKKRR